MDIISHGLIGMLIGQTDGEANTNKILQVGFAALLPDLFQIPYYLVLGHANHRPYWLPENSDWTGFRGKLPWLDLVWDVPHSIFFLILIILPLTLYFELGILFFLGYLSHILVDIPTHTGEWNVRYLYPMNITFNGYTDAWTWSFNSMLLSWTILIMLNFIKYKFNS
jgi:membrane-bound metal-dependent hydrolase YbcI (DUF457 family)